MVKLNVKEETGGGLKKPDIFRAARIDDPFELTAALNFGQSLDDSEADHVKQTPMHIACVFKSTQFLEVALNHKFDPWVRDANGRLAIDHARAQGLVQFQRRFFELMYPNGEPNNITPFRQVDGPS